MTGFLWNILLALIWVAATGLFTFPNLIIGFGLGLLVLSFTRGVVGSPRYVPKVGQVIGLVAFFIWELIVANLRLARDVIRPQHQIRPGVIGIHLDVETDAEITLFANMLTLTPGSLSLDVSDDRKVLYIHYLYVDEDPDEVRRSIKNGFERRILELVR